MTADVAHHGGDRQAVYAYAREELDAWEARLGRTLPDGTFGENLTTRGLEADMVERGVEVQGVEDLAWGRFVYFEDPDGNAWALQELPDYSAHG